MTAARPIHNLAVAAALLLCAPLAQAQTPVPEAGTSAAPAQEDFTPGGVGTGAAEAGVAGRGAAEDRIATLLADLARPDNAGWRRVERQLLVEWSKSGSAALDLLLERGRDALREDDPATAIEHLTALTDHAPDFAEGWNLRATAFFRAGQYGPAMLDLARALALNPKHFGAMSGMGAILSETGNKTAARKVYGEVLAIHPNLATVRDALKRLEIELSGQSI